MRPKKMFAPSASTVIVSNDCSRCRLELCSAHPFYLHGPSITDEGDILIASKHCSHLFHKDCILEWLEKHETCPVCRVDMVTDSEMNQAATSIVGRTRMYVAVESITRSPRHAATNNAGPHRHVLPAHRHIVAAPRTPPSSPPHRYPRTMGYASR